MDEELLELIEQQHERPSLFVFGARRGTQQLQECGVGQCVWRKMTGKRLSDRDNEIEFGEFDVNATVVALQQRGQQTGLQKQSLAVARI